MTGKQGYLIVFCVASTANYCHSPNLFSKWHIQNQRHFFFFNRFLNLSSFYSILCYLVDSMFQEGLFQSLPTILTRHTPTKLQQPLLILPVSSICKLTCKEKKNRLASTATQFSSVRSGHEHTAFAVQCLLSNASVIIPGPALH